MQKTPKNKSVGAIAGEPEEDLSAVENMIGIQRRVGNYDIKQIYDAMQREATE